MVSFLTLLVGLIMGTHDVQLAVSGPVARVEIRLDDTVLAEVAGAPWHARIDLGRRIRPARLEAVGFDATGREIDRDVQWINLPESRAEAEIVPDVSDVGIVEGVRLTWESPEFNKPKQIRVSLDGESLAVRPPYRIDLTTVTLDELHVLDAEFEFSADVCLKRQFVFGKGFSGATSSGLTALPVRLDDLDELPAPDLLSDWFSADDEQPVRVAAVERDAARLVIVRDPGAEPMLRDLVAERKRYAKSQRRGGTARSLDLLDQDVDLRVLVPEPVSVEGRERSTILFPYSKKGIAGDQGLLKAAVAPKNENMLGMGLMLPDGVAMAGLHAAEGNPRRAVLLLLGPEREDITRLDPGDVRSFLADLRVPLVVWDLSGPRGVPSSAWPVDAVIEDFDDLSRATRRLRYQLDEQRIVWVGGRYLPQELGLGPRARGISLIQ